ncbi:MAG: aspartyl protease family protein [Balneolaceae bacterium]|nr:aspartyl protease family protein [Balneolaceae bacterium]
MLLDTGVNPSGIRMDVADELGFEIDMNNQSTISGRGENSYRMAPTKIENLTIQGIEFGEIEAVASEGILELLSKRIGVEIQGILGYSFLNGKTLSINFVDEEIHFFDSSDVMRSKFSDAVLEVDFETETNDIMPILENVVFIKDQPITVSMDTGSNLAIEVFSHYASNYNLKIDSTKTITATGAQGDFELLSTQIENLKVGELELKYIEAEISEVENKNQRRMGNIGNKLLKNFLVGIDYKSGKIYLDANFRGF